MKRSPPTFDPPPQCALGPQDAAGGGLMMNSQRKDDKNYPFSLGNRGRNPPHPMQRQPKREPQPVSQTWPNTAFENSNTSWEGDWSNASSTPPIKSEQPGGGYYNSNHNHRSSSSFQSCSEWSPGESSAGSSYASQSASSSSYYESNNGFYGTGYGSGNLFGYVQPSYPPQQQQQQYHEPARAGFDGSYGNNHRNHPSICPPQAPGKQAPVADFQRKQARYPVDVMPKVQIKREPEDYNEMEGDNFTSLFTKSLTSLYSQDAENAFQEENNKPYEQQQNDLMLINQHSGMDDQVSSSTSSSYQRLGATGGQYGVNSDYQDARNSFGFYDSRPNMNCDPPQQTTASVVEELGADRDRMNSFRYDRPSFDDMHLYTSPPNDTKGQTKKRKMNMPNSASESGYQCTENRKKTPRMVPSYKSDSQWTPNSFAFSDIQIKQEPVDDYGANDMDSQSCGMTYKESSPSSNGNKSPGVQQQSDHPPKQPPRKRSPGATCFDRFDKKSTPTNKKVSPLSVYAKVQDNVVLNVKCRRYKKRTKPIACKEEPVCPGREEMELYKQNSLTPDQAAHQVVNELVERVSLFEERSVIDGPNITQMDAMKVRDLLMQCCHRYSLDYRDFEDINSVLKPRIVKDTFAKNSERASAIRKRTSTSPVRVEPQPVKKASSRAAAKRAAAAAEVTEQRVLRQLPGRSASLGRRQPPEQAETAAVVSERRYSTRDVARRRGENSAQVDIVISSSSDSECEAGKEAEVRKKSQRLKKKKKKSSPAAATPARSSSSRNASKAEPGAKSTERVGTRSCTRSRERANVAKSVPDTNVNRINLRSRKDRIVRKDSTDSMRSSSVEILAITKSDRRSSFDETIDAVIARFSCERRAPKKRKISQKANKKKPVKNAAPESPLLKKQRSLPSLEIEKEEIAILSEEPKERSRKAVPKRITRNNSGIKKNAWCDTSEIKEIEPPKKSKEKKPSPINNILNPETKERSRSGSCDNTVVKEEFSPNQQKSSNKNILTNFDKSVQSTKDLLNSKSQTSAIKMKDDCQNQVDNAIHVTVSNPPKSLKNKKVQKNPFVKLNDNVKVHQESTNKEAKAGLPCNPKPSKLSQRNSKKSATDVFVDDLEEPSSNDSLTPQSASCRVPKNPKCNSISASEEAKKGIKATEPLPQVLKTKKTVKENTRTSIDLSPISNDASQLPKKKSRKSKATKKTLKLKEEEPTKEPVQSNDTPKQQADDLEKPPVSEPEVTSIPLNQDLNTNPTGSDSSISEKEVPVQEHRIPSECAYTKVDDLLAAVSSLVEAEKVSKLLENDKKTIAAQSLLELGNSPQLLTVGGVSTPTHCGPKPETTCRVSSTTPALDSWKFVKENYEVTNPHKPPVTENALYSPNNGKQSINPSSYVYKKSEKYEKQVAVNTPFTYRNYEKRVAVNTPYTYRNSDAYEKPVAVNTPHIFRNSGAYEKAVAVNTPYIFRGSENGDHKDGSNSPPPMRLRKVRSKRPVVNRDSSPHLHSSASFTKEESSSRLGMVTKDANPSDAVEPRLPASVSRNRSMFGRRRRPRPKMFSPSPTPVESPKISDPEPQVVLRKLPDAHVNSKDGSVSAEALKLCEMSEGRDLVRHHLEKPPVLVSVNALHERSPLSRSVSASPPCIHVLEDTDLPVNLSTSSEKPRPLARLRSDSEDSDCGLVIDLDRRTSIEERVPSPTLESSDIIEGMIKASESEDPRSFFSDQPVPSTSSKDTSRSAEEKEAGHTLLELTRTMAPGEEEEFSSAESEERRRGRRARDVRERAKDESILRTLLLETGAIAPKTSQDRSQPGSDSSADSKNPITQEITRLLLLCETNDGNSLSESASMDDRKFPLEIITDLNANSLITDLEADHQDIKEQIRKLKNEIVYLKCIADKKDRERTAVVCFKRYKEEILKRILKRFAFSSNECYAPNRKFPFDATGSVDFHCATTSSHSNNGLLHLRKPLRDQCK